MTGVQTCALPIYLLNNGLNNDWRVRTMSPLGDLKLSGSLGRRWKLVNEAVKYTQERVQFGRRLSQFQNTQFQLADMHTRMQAAQYLVYAAAMKKQNHEDYSMDASMAKLFAAEAASDVTRRAVQLFGGYGYTREYPVERMMRDAKVTEIYEGTSEVQRMVISSRLGVK